MCRRKPCGRSCPMHDPRISGFLFHLPCNLRMRNLYAFEIHFSSVQQVNQRNLQLPEDDNSVQPNAKSHSSQSLLRYNNCCCWRDKSHHFCNLGLCSSKYLWELLKVEERSESVKWDFCNWNYVLSRRNVEEGGGGEVFVANRTLWCITQFEDHAYIPCIKSAHCRIWNQ